jgi:hypothetical protein
VPNWCDNRLKVIGPASAVDEFIAGASRVVDGSSDEELCILRNYIPFPPALEGREIVSESGTFKAFSDRGYDWCLNNWGCKWGDSGTRIIEEVMSDEIRTIIIYMNTPWGPPDQGILQISKIFPELTFILAFHEDGMAFSGVAMFERGGIICDINGGEPPQYIEDKEDEWINAIEYMYDTLFDSV